MNFARILTIWALALASVPSAFAGKIECTNRPNFFITSFSPGTKTAFGRFRCTFPKEVSDQFGITIVEIVGNGDSVNVSYRSNNSLKHSSVPLDANLVDTLYKEGKSVSNGGGFDFVHILPIDFSSPYSIEARIYLLIKEKFFQNFALYDLVDNAEEWYLELASILRLIPKPVEEVKEGPYLELMNVLSKRYSVIEQQFPLALVSEHQKKRALFRTLPHLIGATLYAGREDLLPYIPVVMNDI